MFDYNQIDESENTLTVLPFSAQVKKLRMTTRELNDCILVCHSQGCIVAALARPKSAKKVIMLAPPLSLSAERLIDNFSNREGTIINTTDASKLARRDSSITLIGPEYWQEFDHINPVKLYQELSKSTSITIVGAANDEVLHQPNYAFLKSDKIKVTSLPAGHDFTGPVRQKLIQLVELEINH